MSDTIKWDETIEKDKVQLIIEHVFRYGIVSDSDSQGSNEQPIAFWDRDDMRWHLDDGEDTISFDPLHHMEDTWQVVEQLYKKGYDVHIEMDKDNLCRYHAYGFSMRVGGLEGDGHGSDTSMNEAICVTALRLCGIEVQV